MPQRQRRRRLAPLLPRQICSQRRTRRRRRWPWRPYHPQGQPQHVDAAAAEIPATHIRRQRGKRLRRPQLRQRRRRCRGGSSLRHSRVRRRKRRIPLRSHRRRPGGEAAARRPRRSRQLAFQECHKPHTAICATRRTLDREVGGAGAQDARRRGSCRLPQCRQVHSPLGSQRRRTQNRRLSVHNNGAAAGHRFLPRQPQFRNGRHSRHYRRRQRGTWPGAAFPAPYRAQCRTALHGSRRCRRHRDTIPHPAFRTRAVQSPADGQTPRAGHKQERHARR